MLPPWVIEKIRREEEKRRREGPRIPLEQPPEPPPGPSGDEGESPKKNEPIVIDIFGEAASDGGDGLIRILT